MSQQSDLFVRQVLKGDPKPQPVGAQLQFLRQLAGSGRAAARLIGVGESSLRDWARGRAKPSAASLARVGAAFRAARVRPSRMGDVGIMLHVISQEQKRPVRERDIQGRNLRLQPGTLQASCDVWVSTGDSEAAFRRFVEGIGEPWYRSMFARAAGMEDLVDDGMVLDSDYGMSLSDET